MNGKDDIRLIAATGAVWAALAAIYALVPSLGMPGYIRVWGAGALLFLALAALLVAARRRRSG